MSVRAWYLFLVILSGLLALFVGSLGEYGLFVLFGVSALYFVRRYRHLRKARAAPAPGVEVVDLSEKGGMPLAAIAVASILLAGSAASFYTNASAVNPPNDGICDYDSHVASALYQRTTRDGSVLEAHEFCDDHILYFLVLHPLQSYGLASQAGPDIAFMGLPPAWWAQIFSGLWIAFISLMVLASINIGSRATAWDPVFVVCSMGRGIVAMATGFVATILFMVVSVDLVGRYSGSMASPDRFASLLEAMGMHVLLYLATMLIIIAFLAAFFRQRGGAGR